MQKHVTFHQYVRDFFADGEFETFETKRACAEAIAAEKGLDLSDTQLRRMATEVGRVLEELEKTDEILVGRISDDIPVLESSESGNGSNVVEFDDKEDTASFKFKGSVDKPMTVQELLVASGVDMEVFEVERIKTNAWGVTSKLNEFQSPNRVTGNYLQAAKNYQITVWLRKRVEEVVEDSLQKTLDRFADANKDYSPLFSTLPHRPTPDDVVAVVNLYDAHLDKIALPSTTGEQGGLAENVQIFKNALEELCVHLEQAMPEYIIYPLGNDLYHTNNFEGTTKKGTNLEVLEDEYAAYDIITEVAVDSINRLREIAPVHLMFIHGNHDYDKVATLATACRLIFKDCDDVVIDDRRIARKYIRYGINLFGFSHGDKQKQKIAELPQMMAQENRANGDWGASKVGQFYCGDLHHKFTVRFPNDKDYIGVNVAFLRSIGRTDTWHSDHGYIGVHKEATVDIWSKTGGKKATFSTQFQS
jgi:hypothetical protein